MPYTAAPIALDEKTRTELERRVRAGTCAQREVRRAKIILMAADGVPSRQDLQGGRHALHAVDEAPGRGPVLTNRTHNLWGAPHAVNDGRQPRPNDPHSREQEIADRVPALRW